MVIPSLRLIWDSNPVSLCVKLIFGCLLTGEPDEAGFKSMDNFLPTTEKHPFLALQIGVLQHLGKCTVK